MPRVAVGYITKYFSEGLKHNHWFELKFRLASHVQEKSRKYVTTVTGTYFNRFMHFLNSIFVEFYLYSFLFDLFPLKNDVKLHVQL